MTVFFFVQIRTHKRMLPHGDNDHIAGLVDLINNYDVKSVIFNCGPYNDLEKELIKVLDKKKIKHMNK